MRAVSSRRVSAQRPARASSRSRPSRSFAGARALHPFAPRARRLRRSPLAEVPARAGLGAAEVSSTRRSSRRAGSARHRRPPGPPWARRPRSRRRWRGGSAVEGRRGIDLDLGAGERRHRAEVREARRHGSAGGRRWPSRSAGRDLELAPEVRTALTTAMIGARAASAAVEGRGDGPAESGDHDAGRRPSALGSRCRSPRDEG